MTVLLVDDIILYPIPEGVEVLDSSLAPKAKRKSWRLDLDPTSGGLGLLDRHVSEELLLALNQISDLRSNQNVFVLTALCIEPSDARPLSSHKNLHIKTEMGGW